MAAAAISDREEEEEVDPEEGCGIEESEPCGCPSRLIPGVSAAGAATQGVSLLIGRSVWEDREEIEAEEEGEAEQEGETEEGTEGGQGARM